jgi:hypothetical protein
MHIDPSTPSAKNLVGTGSFDCRQHGIDITRSYNTVQQWFTYSLLASNEIRRRRCRLRYVAIHNFTALVRTELYNSSHLKRQNHEIKNQMKIIIIGAGLSGLTTALALQKYVAPRTPRQREPLEIEIYDESEVRPSGTVEYGWRNHSDIRNQQQEGGRKRNQGAAISLQSNAFKVLRDLDRELADRVHASGLPCRGFPWKSRGDWVLGREGLEACLIPRPVVIEILMEALLERGIEVEYRTVREVETVEGRKLVVRFLGNGADDDEEVADLVIGADGISSEESFRGRGGDETKVSVSLAFPDTLNVPYFH